MYEWLCPEHPEQWKQGDDWWRYYPVRSCSVLFTIMDCFTNWTVRNKGRLWEYKNIACNSPDIVQLCILGTLLFNLLEVVLKIEIQILPYLKISCQFLSLPPGYWIGGGVCEGRLLQGPLLWNEGPGPRTYWRRELITKVTTPSSTAEAFVTGL